MTTGRTGYGRESRRCAGSTSPRPRGAAIPSPSTAALSPSRYACWSTWYPSGEGAHQREFGGAGQTAQGGLAPQSGRPVGLVLLIHETDGKPRAGIGARRTRLMPPQSPRNIGGDAGIEGTVAATEHVHGPHPSLVPLPSSRASRPRASRPG